MCSTKKIGLIAGGGDIPPQLVRRWVEGGYAPCVVCLDAVQYQILSSMNMCHDICLLGVGQAGAIRRFFRNHDVHNLVLIGTIPRPNFWTLRTDSLGMMIVFQLLWKVGMGDNRLLSFLRSKLADFGLHVHGVQEFLPELLCPSGILSEIGPELDDNEAIHLGVQSVREHGAADKGQAVVMCDGRCLAFETSQGTRELIESCADLQGRKILIKMSKPQQDMDLDAPTVGPSTIESLIRSGFSGLVIESGHVLLVNRDSFLRTAKEHKIFVLGYQDGLTW